MGKTSLCKKLKMGYLEKIKTSFGLTMYLGGT